ncbi:aldo/keto reductase [Bacillus sp. sid0103]|uniref:aldo/keto reductase n=1 Tax=Bacillus sp. sid0103 TaxID=2856337 RepID=UPI001C46E49D|nr:aldo/keto reductase [Bacillus sp. sid0103]MBV7504293.1 aldo/keto reductase [Bacillus sp. sid0103]
MVLNWAQKLAEEKGASAIEIALAYVLNQHYPTAAIISPEKVEELLSSLKGSEILLTSEEMDLLNLCESKIGGAK